MISLLRPLRITEHSMYPVYQEGDYVLVSSIPLLIFGFQLGDVIVFEHPQHGKLIKVVDRVEDGGKSLHVIGLMPDSVDSRIFGLVPRSMVIGKVVGHIRKKRA